MFPMGLLRYEAAVSLVHPERCVIQLIEARGTSGQKYHPQAEDVRSYSQGLSSVGFVGRCVRIRCSEISLRSADLPRRDFAFCVGRHAREV